MTENPPGNDNNGQLCTTDHLKRVIWPDVIRIVSVFAMIMLHAAAVGFGRFGARTVSWQVCNLYDSLVRFCVPVFVMVSGMFLLNPEREYGLKKLYLSKIMRIVTAYLFWATFYSILSLIAIMVRSGVPEAHRCLYIFVRGILCGRFHLWFLFMITGLYIVTPLLRLIVKNDKLTIYFLVLGLIFVYGTNLANLFPPTRKLIAITITRLNVQLVAGYSCYFIWGYWLSKHSISPAIRKTIYIMGLLAAISTVVLNGLAGYYFNVAGEWMYNNLLPNILMMATAVFVFCQYHFQGKQLSVLWQRRIGLIGRWSFGIYLVHLFFLTLLPRVGLPHFFCHPIVSIPITTLLVFFASLAVMSIMDKIPILNKYVM